ncbi:alpha-defensin 20-like [Chionomys nivalis]|uniref:alpha-defensin 20-like n=1 Tax=Chionomys nivalis TaxID=269649 RepID=UPI00259A2B11|nr:alpha-defensin 20-like [Chionomys nivalis]
MKTLVLLSLLALLAFQAQADALPEAAEETKTDEQPGVEDQDVSISFGDPEGSALQDGASRKIPLCICKKVCRFHERAHAICGGNKLLCCS